MTQEKALQEFQQMFPDRAGHLAASRERSIGAKHGFAETYTLWDFSRTSSRTSLVAQSHRSWEHALAIAKSGDEDCWPEEGGPWEDEPVSA